MERNSKTGYTYPHPSPTVNTTYLLDYRRICSYDLETVKKNPTVPPTFITGKHTGTSSDCLSVMVTSSVLQNSSAPSGRTLSLSGRFSFRSCPKHLHGPNRSHRKPALSRKKTSSRSPPKQACPAVGQEETGTSCSGRQDGKTVLMVGLILLLNHSCICVLELAMFKATIM